MFEEKEKNRHPIPSKKVELPKGMGQGKKEKSKSTVPRKPDAMVQKKQGKVIGKMRIGGDKYGVHKLLGQRRCFPILKKGYQKQGKKKGRVRGGEGKS